MKSIELVKRVLRDSQSLSHSITFDLHPIIQNVLSKELIKGDREAYCDRLRECVRE